MRMPYQTPTKVGAWSYRATTPKAKAQSAFVELRIARLFRSEMSPQLREFVIGVFEEYPETHPVYMIQIPEVGEIHFAYSLGSWIISCDSAVPVKADIGSPWTESDIRQSPLMTGPLSGLRGLMPCYGPFAADNRRFTIEIRERREGEHFEIYAFMYVLSRALGCPRR